MSDYETLLKHPNWQRMRLRIMERADWKCECCGEKEEELNVHHILYNQGRMPWDYPLENLRCLCKTCHTLRHVPEHKLRAWCAESLVDIKQVTWKDDIIEKIRRSIECKNVDETAREKLLMALKNRRQEMDAFQKSVQGEIDETFRALNERRLNQ